MVPEAQCKGVLTTFFLCVSPIAFSPIESCSPQANHLAPYSTHSFSRQKGPKVWFGFFFQKNHLYRKYTMEECDQITTKQILLNRLCKFILYYEVFKPRSIQTTISMVTLGRMRCFPKTRSEASMVKDRGVKYHGAFLKRDHLRLRKVMYWLTRRPGEYFKGFLAHLPSGFLSNSCQMKWNICISATSRLVYSQKGLVFKTME